MIDKIWSEGDPYIIAEISQNHDGSLGQAHAYIDAVATTGADAIKFQTHIACEESTKYEPFRVNFSYEDSTRYDYWKRMEFTFEQWNGLYEHAVEKGLDFLSSPFSVRALRMLDKIGIPAWKFGAGEVFDNLLFDEAVATGKPILLSTGLSIYSEIDEQIEKLKRTGNKFILFQCTTAYPSTAEMIDINLIRRYIERYQCNVGISDHSATIYPALAATVLGASAVEVHVTMNSYMFGPDVKASVNLEELKQIVEGTRFISKMNKTFTDMSIRTDEREALKKMFSKSLYAAENIPKGTIFTKDMFLAKKPNIGVDVKQIDSVVGKTSVKMIQKDEPIKIEDFE